MKNVLKITGTILAGLGAIICGGKVIADNLPKKAVAETVDAVTEDSEYYEETEE